MLWSRLSIGCAGAVLVFTVPGEAQLIPFEQRAFSEQILRPAGQPVIPLFEGWYENPDGTYGVCFGYFNLNTEEAVDIPLGADNFIEPSQFDGMQPTHFDPVPEANYRRRFCVFSVTVPEDFGRQELVWTLRTHRETLSTPGKLTLPYILDEPDAGGRGVVAPTLKFESDGIEFRGRRGFTAPPRTVAVGELLDLAVWVDHPGPTSWVGWSEHQGPGDVAFSESEVDVQQTDPVARTTARFSEPGKYLIRVQSIFSTTSFEYHCCWTNGYVPVTVTH